MSPSVILSTVAQITADTMGPIVPWILGGSGTIFLLNQVLEFYKNHIREHPIPADSYATKHELREAHGRIKREREEINGALAELREEDLRLRDKLDNEIKELRDEMIAVPEKTIDLLIKTKGWNK